MLSKRKKGPGVSERPETATRLLERAQQLLPTLRLGARRAFVVELTGTPKSGKTTSLGLLASFFKAAGYKVRTLKERAADCPLPMKGHFFFNAWTTCTMLAEVLAIHETDVDLIFLDRGFFDALVWLELQRKRGQVTGEENKAFSSFVLLERWRSLVDLTIVMTAEPQTALDREQGLLLVPRRGSLMNAGSLGSFNKALQTARSRHKRDFTITQVDTSKSGDAKETAIEVLEDLLPRLEAWSDRQIAYVPRSLLKKTFGSQRRFMAATEAVKVWKELAPRMRHERRSKVEGNDALVQVVVGGIPVHAGKVFVFKRAEGHEKSAYGRATIWRGCHVESRFGVSMAGLKRSLTARLQEDLHLRITLPLELLGMAWDPDQKPESRHLGVLFRCAIEDDVVAESMHEKEFRKAGRGHKLTGEFHEPEAILIDIDALALEPWSHSVVQNLELRG